MEEIILQVQKKFKELYGENPMLFRSPGRVNLIGEHTDYNEGFVLPAAVDKAIYIALSPRKDRKCFLFANDLNQSHEFHASDLVKSEKRWPNYIMGVVDQIQKAGHVIPGFNCVFGGDIPIGAGMSSSAAIEAGLAFALNKIFGLNIDRLDLVKLSQKAENEFVGVRCGIMDQFINIFGKPKKVLKLDCRSLEYTYFPFEREDLKIVLCDTQVPRALASSEYNIRRQQCESGVKLLQKYAPSIKSLRDVSLELLEAHQQEFDSIIYKRCDYVIRENLRVETACKDLERGDFHSFGQQMYDSHAGLRDGYEVSCRELDILVEAASEVEGVLGARLMGAGFGGCTINLVEEEAVENFSEKVSAGYQAKTGRESKIYVTRLLSGTEQIAATARKHPKFRESQ
jgi:galactokinase